MNIKRAEEVLLKAKEIFDACYVEFFLICGTCLGAIREGRIFPYDGDIDLGVKHEILKEKIDTLKSAFLYNGYTAEIRTSQYNYPRSIDFRIDEILGEDLVHICVRDYDLSGDKRFHARIDQIGTCSVFDKRLFDNLKKVEFLGKEFLVPNPPEEFLKAHFGDWKTPRPTDHTCQADIEGSFNYLLAFKDKK